MAPRPNPPAGTIRVAVTGFIASCRWTNIFWVQAVGTPTNDDLHDFNVAFRNALQTHLGVLTPDFMTMQEIRSQWFGVGSEVVQADALGFTGSETGQAILAGNTALLISWHTNQIYRGGKPRTYWAGVYHDQTNGNRIWLDTTLTAYGTGAAAFRTAVNAITTTNLSSVTLGVVRFFAAGGSTQTPPVYLTPPVFHAFTGSSIQPRICTQRRRLGAEVL